MGDREHGCDGDEGSENEADGTSERRGAPQWRVCERSIFLVCFLEVLKAERIFPFAQGRFPCEFARQLFHFDSQPQMFLDQNLRIEDSIARSFFALENRCGFLAVVGKGRNWKQG